MYSNIAKILSIIEKLKLVESLYSVELLVLLLPPAWLLLEEKLLFSSSDKSYSVNTIPFSLSFLFSFININIFY